MISYERLFEKLKGAELSSYKLKKMEDPIIAQGTLTRLKHGNGGIDSNTLNRLCKYFDCQPGDLMEYIPDPSAPAMYERMERTKEIQVTYRSKIRV